MIPLFNFPECRRGWHTTETGEEIPDGEGRVLKLEIFPRLIVTGEWFDDTEIPIKPPQDLTFKQKINWLKHYGQYLLDEPEVLYEIIQLSRPAYRGPTTIAELPVLSDGET